MTWDRIFQPYLRRGYILAVVVLVAAGCATSDSPLRYTVQSPVTPFGDIFAPSDTIRLDMSVVVGRVSFLDVSEEGQLLIADGISKSTYQFSASGKHIHTYSIGTCQPDHADASLWLARFIGGGRVMLVGSNGVVAVVDESGDCVATELRHPVAIAAACTIRDTVLMQAWYSPVLQPEVYAVSRDLDMLDTWQIEKPDFPGLNTLLKGKAGRSMECFADGPYYTYAEWSDALPVFTHADIAQVDPIFFKKRLQDIELGTDLLSKVDEVKEYPNNSGVLAIDSTTRMIVYSGLTKAWVSPNAFQRRGVAVVSNVGAFPPVTSAVPPHFNLIGAANGYLYRRADPEVLPDGDVGNPLILRYEFIPPTDATP